MNKHTQGPWHVETNFRTCNMDHIAVVANDGRSVALTGFTCAGDKEESIANAIIIAASFDLLTALKQIASNADLYHSDTIREIASIAIAKATGGQP